MDHRPLDAQSDAAVARAAAASRRLRETRKQDERAKTLEVNNRLRDFHTALTQQLRGSGRFGELAASLARGDIYEHIPRVGFLPPGIEARKAYFQSKIALFQPIMAQLEARRDLIGEAQRNELLRLHRAFTDEFAKQFEGKGTGRNV